MKVRRLNDAGIQQFGDFLDSLKADTPQPWPKKILADPTTSEPVHPEVQIEQRTFRTRLEVAKYLNEELADAGIPNLERDKGLWAWLALFFFEQLCPVGKDGRQEGRQRERFIPVFSESRRYYRHLLAGPYRIYRAHRDDPSRAMILLCGPPTTLSRHAWRIAGSQQHVTNRVVLEVATELYFDPESNTPKRGSGTYGRPGTVDRLVDVLNQLDVTWDLYAIDAQQLLQMLPAEFDRFRVNAGGIGSENSGDRKIPGTP